MSLDPYYTPKAIADLLVAAVTTLPRSIGDFAAGGGALLAAGAERWPDAKLVATDLDLPAVEALRQQFPAADVRHIDFLAAGDLPGLEAAVDLVLLNPPFSCRGNSKRRVEVVGEALTCSLAMAFVCQALPLLSADGELVCILPASCLTSQKDAAARAAVGRAFGVQIVKSNLREAFAGCAVSVAIVRISRAMSLVTGWTASESRQEEPQAFTAHLTLGRGATAVHTAEALRGRTRLPFVHTTDIGPAGRGPVRRWSARRPDISADLALLVPRVGRPNRNKLILVEGEPLVLSDCLFWIRGGQPGDEVALQEQLLANWDWMSSVYGGSCAPYTTLEGLKRFLEDLGHTVRLAPPATLRATKAHLTLAVSTPPAAANAGPSVLTEPRQQRQARR